MGIAIGIGIRLGKKIYIDSVIPPEPDITPSIQGVRTKTLINVSNTSHSINLPGNIAVGEMIFVAFAVALAPTITINTGISGNKWTLGTPVSNETNITLVYAYKIAEGSDVLTLTTGDARQSSSISFRILNGNDIYFASATGSTTNASPPSLTPSAGLHEYLWIVIGGWRGNKDIVSLPTDFDNFIEQNASGPSGTTIASGDRTYEGTILDPETFNSPVGYWVSFTIAIN